MRPLEPTLIALIAFSFVFGRQQTHWPTRARLALIALLPILFILQLALGLPWSMIPLWLAGGCYAALLLVNLRKPGKIHRLWLIPGFALALISLLAAWIAPVFALPQPPGPYAIGVRRYHWVDEQRPELFSENPATRRELLVHIYYPASQTDGFAALNYLPNAAQLSPYFAEAPLPPFFFSQLAIPKTHSYQNAPLRAEGPYPLIIFSHGMGWLDVANTILVEELVSRGYVVAVINHTYSSAVAQFSEQRIVDFQEKVPGYPNDGEYCYLPKPEELARLQQWVDDQGFVLHQLEKLNQGQPEPEFRGQLDLEKLGAAGHSFGGNTSANSCQQNPRFKACAILDASWDNRIPTRQPILMFEGSLDTSVPVVSDKELAQHRATRQEFEQMVKDGETAQEDDRRFYQSWADGNGPLYQIKICQAEHLDFTDAVLLTPLFRFQKMTGELGATRMIQITNAYTLDFFDHYLKSLPSQLLSGPNPLFPEVEFAQFPAP